MKKGSVTIFLTFVLPMVFILVLTLIESARFGGVRLRARDAGTAAVGSVLAGYDRTLLDRYGLLFYDGGFGAGTIDFEKIEEEFLHYFDRNISVNSLLDGGSLYPARAEQAEIADIVTATDYNGSIFVRSALDYFKYDLLGELTDSIRSYVDEILKGEKANSEAMEGQGQLENTDWGNSDSGTAGTGFFSPKGKLDDGGSGEAKPLLLTENGATGRVINLDEEASDGKIDQSRLNEDISKSPIGGAKKAQKGGWLSLVLPANRDISGELADLTNAPSQTATDNRKMDDEGFLNDASNLVLFNEYLMKNYSSFTDNSEKDGMKYEVEYLIYGYEKDSVNLGTVLNRIMWIREGINLLYLTSSDRKAVVKEIAAAMFSWTENPLIIELGAVALLAAWAYGEAILDVRSLLEGKKIDFLKTDENWMLGYENLPDLFNGARFQTKASPNGLDYAHAFQKQINCGFDGSYTIEAALTVPLFMVVIISLLLFFSAGVAEIRLEGAMETVGRRLSYYYFAIEEIQDNYFSETKGTEDTGNPGDNAVKEAIEPILGAVLWAPVSETLVRSMVQSETSDKWADGLLVDGGLSGISYFGSYYDSNEETIVLKASYNLKTPFGEILDVRIPITVVSVHRVWSGKETEKGTDEQLVYVTETGTVYHTSLNCTHLKLSIREVSFKTAASSRNESGGKYAPCERCGKGEGGKVYITDYGDRYHYDRNCSGLKRSIQSIPISKVGQRPLCKKCAQKGK